MNKRKLRKNINKIKKLIDKNYDRVERVIVTEDFLEKLIEVPDLSDLNSIYNKETELDEWYIFKKPVVFSNFLKEGFIIELKNGEFIAINNI